MSKIKDISSIEVSDTEIIAGIADGDNRVINKIYKSFFPSIAHMIVNNNGTDEEAKDVFQEAVMVLYDKITHHKFELNSKLSTFLYAVSRRLWLKQLSRKGHTTNTTDISDFEDILRVEDDIQEHQEIENQFDQMNEAMTQLGEPCQTLLKDFYIQNLSMQEITQKFGYTNSDNAKTQKYKCLQRLKKIFFTIKIKE